MTSPIAVNLATETEQEMLKQVKTQPPQSTPQMDREAEEEKKQIDHASSSSSSSSTNNNNSNPIPVTILSGFLGSGKTTLLKNILESSDHKLKVAVIVNDMAELNIDADLVKQQPNQTIVQAEREIISLQNGCICCTLRGDLIREIARIQSSQDNFDYILIESTGIAEPQQVAQSFVFDPATEQLAASEEEMLWTRARLDTCVTVIDAHMFLPQLATLKQFGDLYEDGLDKSTPDGVKEGEKPIANLLVDQVEFANVILLNKVDLVVEKEQLEKTKKVIQSLNPNAKIMCTEYSKVDLAQILNTGIFDMKKASSSSGWIQEIRKIRSQADPHAHSEADEYGVNSFVYRARVPFHPARIGQWVDSILHFSSEWALLPEEQRLAVEKDPKYKLLLERYGNVLRAKGFCWLAEHDSFIIGITQSGRIGSLAPIMPWYTIIPKEQWGVEDGSPDMEVIKSKFEEPHGDRRQEIVFIGSDLKVDNITQDLDKCLLTKKELKRYKFYSDQGSLGQQQKVEIEEIKDDELV